MKVIEFPPVVQMSFKDISYLERWHPLCSVERNNFDRSHHEEQLYEIIFNLDLWFRRCRLKYISYLELWRSFLAEQNQMYHFGKEHHEEQFCEMILNLDQ